MHVVCDGCGEFANGLFDPVSMDQYQTMGVATRMVHAIDFNVEDGGKSIWYRFRWIGTRGEVGTWSDVVSAKIWN